MISDRQWTRLEHIDTILMQLDNSLFGYDCNDMMFNNEINEYQNGWCISKLRVRLSNPRVSVCQCMMSRKILKKVKGNILKSLTLNSFLKQMTLKDETYASVIDLIVKVSEVTKNE